MRTIAVNPYTSCYRLIFSTKNTTLGRENRVKGDSAMLLVHTKTNHRQQSIHVSHVSFISEFADNI